MVVEKVSVDRVKAKLAMLAAKKKGISESEMLMAATQNVQGAQRPKIGEFQSVKSSLDNDEDDEAFEVKI